MPRPRPAPSSRPSATPASGSTTRARGRDEERGSDAVIARAGIAAARRIVVKVGSSSISGDERRPDRAARRRPRRGARARRRGRPRLVGRDRHRACPYLRARRAARPTSRPSRPRPPSGRTCSSTATRTACDRYGIVAGQVLLTAGDLENPTPPQQRPARHGATARACASCRSSTRTTRSRRTRSASATTTGSRRSSPSSSAPTLLVLLSDVDALYTRPPHEPGAPTASRTCRSATTSAASSSASVVVDRRRHRGSGDQGLRGARSPRHPASGVLVTATDLVARGARAARTSAPGSSRPPSPSRPRSGRPGPIRRPAAAGTPREYALGAMTQPSRRADRARTDAARRRPRARSIGLATDRGRQARRRCGRSPTRLDAAPREIVAANARRPRARPRGRTSATRLLDRLRLDEPRVAAPRRRRARHRRAPRPGRPRARESHAAQRRRSSARCACRSASSARSTRPART